MAKAGLLESQCPNRNVIAPDTAGKVPVFASVLVFAICLDGALLADWAIVNGLKDTKGTPKPS